MPTGTADSRKQHRILSALLPTLLCALLTACGDDSPVAPSDPQADVVAGIERTLRQRASAILDRDPVKLGRTLAQKDPEFVADQERYLDNLGQLPLEVVRYDVAAPSVEAAGRGYWAEVTVRLQIEGYDVSPVITRDRWRFQPSRDGRRYLLASVTDPAWEADHGPQPQPWDLGPIEVRTAPGVLGIFDETTLGSAYDVLDSVSEARFAVRSVLPLDIEDPGGVIVYALGDPAFLESLDGLPVDDPDQLDGATVPVPHDASAAGGAVSSYRILLSPHVLDEEEQVLDRLVRHELTHVAVGDQARGVPLWFSEGLAEYVSVQPIVPAERRLQTDALNLAAAGVSDLPADEEFAGPHAEGWYAVSWWVCEYIAANYDQDSLWLLLDELADGADQEQVISDRLGISTSALVQGGIDLMRSTYG